MTDIMNAISVRELEEVLVRREFSDKHRVFIINERFRLIFAKMETSDPTFAHLKAHFLDEAARIMAEPKPYFTRSADLTAHLAKLKSLTFMGCDPIKAMVTAPTTMAPAMATA